MKGIKPSSTSRSNDENTAPNPSITGCTMAANQAPLTITLSVNKANMSINFILLINKMKLIDIFALFTLSVMVKGAWLAAIVQPVILGLGAVFSSFDLDVLDGLMPFINKQATDLDGGVFDANDPELTPEQEKEKKADEEKDIA